ncbi:MAG: hypothetical protein K0V04_18770 [Deltaproteobacteria bacterium]|nr:hypothetical protein [Deltaproteobacteria bacterium]
MSPASAHEGLSGFRSYNVKYTGTIQNDWGHTCTFEYQFGNVWTVAYAKFRILESTDTCVMSVKTRTTGSTPAGERVVSPPHQSWHGATGWFQSGQAAYSIFDYAEISIQLSNGIFAQYFDVPIGQWDNSFTPNGASVTAWFCGGPNDECGL